MYASTKKSLPLAFTHITLLTSLVHQDTLLMEIRTKRQRIARGSDAACMAVFIS